jgi:ArsR family transcriptional regulator, arsenate/arsenite/antimonite-responsive transcriptional repressor
MDIMEILKALADETRIRILHLLHKDVLCVCDLEAILKLSQSNASRHLTKLKTARLITSDKQAQWVYYRLDEKTLRQYSFVRELLQQDLAGQVQCQNDLARLKMYREQGGNCDHSVVMGEA